MVYAVLIVAIIIVTVGISLIIQPVSVREIIQRLLKTNWIWPVSVIRLIIGVSFIWQASETRFPLVISVIGGAVIFAAIAVPLLGKDRMDSWAGKFLDMPDYVLRLCGIVALLFGIALAMTGIP